MISTPHPPSPPASRSLGEYDLVILGADLAGCAAAVAARRAGARVLVIEPGIHPAPDLFASLDIAHDTATRGQIAAELGLDVNAVSCPSGLAWHPCLLKTALEDSLAAAGAELLYLLNAYAWKSEGGFISLSLAGKSGLWSVRTRHVLDASLNGVFVPAFAERLNRPPGDIPELHRVEFSRVDPSLLPAGMPISRPVGRPLRWIPGGNNPGHVWIDFEISDGQTPGRLAERLLDSHPAFSGARIARVAAAPLNPRPPLLAQSLAFHPRPGFRIAGPAGASTPLAADELGSSPLARIRLGKILGAATAFDRTPSCGEGRLPVSLIETEVLVVGGGTTGTSAALAASGAGSSVILIEMNPHLGGTGTAGGINSYWFGRREGQPGRFSAGMKTAEQADSYAPDFAGGTMRMWNVEMKKTMLASQCASSGVRTWTSSSLLAPVLEENRVIGSWIITPEGLLRVSATVTVDATGDGDLAAGAGAAYTYGGETTASTMWCTLCTIPEPGRYRSNFTSGVDVRDPRDLTRIIRSMRRRFQGAYDHADYLATRESRHIHAEAMVTLEDQLMRRKWPDVVAVCFSNHDVKGYSESRWVRVGLIPPNLECEVPFRALVPQSLEGLLVTGKALGATADGLPAIRMQADFENLGYATGLAAALAVGREGCVRSISVDSLQSRLADGGLLEAKHLGRPPRAELPPCEDELSAWAGMLAGEPALNSYQLMKMSERFEGTLPIVRLVAAGPRSIPHLLRALDSAGAFQAAIGLALLGDRRGSPVLLAHVRSALSHAILPPVSHRVLYAHAAPDQGNMPETANCLHALAYAREPAVIPFLAGLADRIEATDTRLRDPASGLFDYVDAICHVAQSLADPDCLPALEKLGGFPLFRDNLFTGAHQIDWFGERKAFLEIRIATAAAACGSASAARRLASFLQDSRRPLVNHAETALRILAQQAPHAPTPHHACLSE